MAIAAVIEAGRVEQKCAELMGRLGGHFARVEPFTQAGSTCADCSVTLPRKNCWTLAEYAGDANPDRMQRLWDRASWDTLAAMDHLSQERHTGDDAGRARTARC